MIIGRVRVLGCLSGGVFFGVGGCCYLMIWGQSLQALAFRLARASQAGSVDTCEESLDGKRLDTSLTAGGDGVESAISTGRTEHGGSHDTHIKFGFTRPIKLHHCH